jgi:hypothetical protein
MQAEIVFEENVEKNLMEDKIMVEDNNSKQYASLAERIAAERIQKSQAQPRSLRSIARNPNRFYLDLQFLQFTQLNPKTILHGALTANKDLNAL